MNLHEIKEHLQNHLSDGLVIIIGSGLSCAEGIPGTEKRVRSLIYDTMAAEHSLLIFITKKKWPDL